jgi:galactokinase
MIRPVMEELLDKAAATYRRRFGAEPQALAWAPGRLEILGNHTDYNGGFVLSVALEHGIAAAAGELPGRRRAVEVWSAAFDELVEISLEQIEPAEPAWANYPRGVLREIERSGTALRGFRLALESSLPAGAGVSSSAALELAVAEAAYALSGGRPREPMEEAKLCQRAEVEFVGVPCGLLDQFSSLFGRKGHALFLDCATLEHERLPLGRDDLALVIAESGVQHALRDGQYAALRRHCERAAERLGALLGRSVRQLRDVGLDELLRAGDRLPPEERRRAEHVVRENARVLAGREALRSGRLETLGRLMLESHASSRDLFGNSCPELDFLVARAEELEGFLGGKLTGGGFGGSTVNLVASAEVERFSARLGESFARRFGRPLRLLSTAAGEGARGRRLGR